MPTAKPKVDMALLKHNADTLKKQGEKNVAIFLNLARGLTAKDKSELRAHLGITARDVMFHGRQQQPSDRVRKAISDLFRLYPDEPISYKMVADAAAVDEEWPLRKGVLYQRAKRRIDEHNAKVEESVAI